MSWDGDPDRDAIYLNVTPSTNARTERLPDWALLRRVLGALLGGGLGFVPGLERARLRHRDDVVAGIHEMNVAGDPRREIAEQVERSAADLVDRNGAPQRRVALLEVEHQPRLGNARS